MITVVSPGFKIMTPLTGLVELVEQAGRVCYKSEDRIAPGTAEQFVNRIVTSGHESVLEHASVTVRIIGSRAMSHQLIRHRIGAVSQESMRYCNYGRQYSLKVICPPSIGLAPSDYTITYFEVGGNDGWFVEKNGNPWEDGSTQQLRWLELTNATYKEYLTELEEGAKPEDARFILPNATKTEVVTTFNLRQWRHVFKMRCDSHAQWEIRAIMKGILAEFASAMPCVFNDLAAKYLGDLDG